MCRLLLMTGLRNPDLVEKFMKEAKIPMSWGNTHGLGYSATKKDGEFFTERWHNNDAIFNRVNVMDEDTSKLLLPYRPKLPKGALDVDYSLQGKIDFSQVGSVTMHTRFATCGREFFNTHPFVDGDTSLVHNGIISNADKLKLNKISTCDSESALQAYINNNVGAKIENAQAWLDMLAGYWAFGVFSRDANGTRILDVIRNDAGLYYSEVDGFGKVMATTNTIIETACKELGLGYTKPTEIDANTLFRFNASTGELMTHVKLKDSSLNRSYYGMGGGMSDSDYLNVTGKAKERENKPIREYKGRVNYGDGSYKIMFKDGGYTLYNSMGKVIEYGVEEEKKTQALALAPSGIDQTTKASENESPSEDEPAREFSSYEELFKYLDNVDEPLVDRLYEYDNMFMTNHGQQFECIPDSMRDDRWQFDLFDEVLEEISAVYDFYFGEERGGM